MVEATHRRVDLATEQLDVALELFLSGRSMVSALTLGGACEEILGKALTLQGKKTTLQDEHSLIAPIEQILASKPYSWKNFVEEKNRARNSAKHMRDNASLTITADLEDEALWMLVRAIDNYRRLDMPHTERMHEFDEWFAKNVVGLDYDG